MLGKLLFHPNIFPLFFLVLFVGNTFLFGSATLGTLLLILYLAVYGWQLGSVIAPQEEGPLRWWIGALVLLSTLILVLTGAYYSATVPKELIIILILLTPPLIGILSKKQHTPSLFLHLHRLWSEHKHRLSRSTYLASALILFLSAMFIETVRQSAITDAVRSPFERVDLSILILVGLAILLLFGLLIQGHQRALTLPLVSLVLFVFLSFVLFIFPLGYGFDPFIHRATEDYLAQFGTITPKPLYYIGQYVLVLFLHHGFQLPIQIADTFLVPIATALFLPIALLSAAVHITGKKRLALATLTGLFLIPLSSFIVTTPQSLSNLFTLLLILASVPYVFESERPRLWLCGILALTSLAIHPIAGIPALIYFAMLCMDPTRVPTTFKPLARMLFVITLIIASVILPASFLINAAFSGQSISFDVSALNPWQLLQGFNIRIFFENQYNPALDFAYLAGKNSYVLFVITAIYGWWTYRKELSERTRILLWMTLAIVINYLIMKTAINFSFLINYERLNYAQRLIPITAFFLIPFFLLGLAHVYINLKSRPLVLRASFMLLLVACSVSSFYLLYPRRDAYETSHAFNTSASDISAVHFIEEWANQEPYLVLANQSVSAAAISEIGFRYYDSLFFYPIPTGDVLYQQFLNMNDTPTRAVAQQALKLVPMHGDVFTLFYVVNNYWWDATRIIEQAKTTADDWRAIGGVSIFRYDFHETPPQNS